MDHSFAFPRNKRSFKDGNVTRVARKMFRRRVIAGALRYYFMIVGTIIQHNPIFFIRPQAAGMPGVTAQVGRGCRGSHRMVGQWC
jgi:hypothetical protein